MEHPRSARRWLVLLVLGLPSCISLDAGTGPVGLECMSVQDLRAPSTKGAVADAASETWAEADCAFFLEPAETELSFPSTTAAQSPQEEQGQVSDRAAPRLLYLQRHGGIYSPAPTNHSGRDRSSLLSVDVDIPPFAGGAEEWSALEACVERRFSRFGLMVTSDDPGEEPHIEAVIGGHPCQLALPDRVRGVSPLADDCSVLERAVVFVFAHAISSPDVLCDVTVHEVGHALGLEHAYLCDDVMSYLQCGRRSFQDEDSSCGAKTPQACVCQEKQNSAGHLYGTLGVKSGADIVSPTVRWRTIPEVETLSSGDVIDVVVDAYDDDKVDVVKIFVEGDETRLYECRVAQGEDDCTQSGASTFRFRFPVYDSDRKIRAHAFDLSGNKADSPVVKLWLRDDSGAP